MANNYMEQTMDMIVAQMRRLSEADADAIQDEVARSKAVVACAEQVFDGQRANNETVHLQIEIQKSMPIPTKATTIRRVISSGEAPYYAKQRAALEGGNDEFLRDTVAANG